MCWPQGPTLVEKDVSTSIHSQATALNTITIFIVMGSGLSLTATFSHSKAALAPSATSSVFVSSLYDSQGARCLLSNSGQHLLSFLKRQNSSHLRVNYPCARCLLSNSGQHLPSFLKRHNSSHLRANYPCARFSIFAVSAISLSGESKCLSEI